MPDQHGEAGEAGGKSGVLMGEGRVIVLGRNTHRMFTPAWLTQPRAGSPAPLMNETKKCKLSTL
jgi:hypothetical protein